MSKHRQTSPATTGDSLLPPPSGPGSNALPLDQAPRILLGSGLEGRYGLCPLATLLPNPDRVQVHSRRQLDKLARSVEVSGPLAPAIVDEGYVLLAGHARLEVAKRQRAANLPVVQVFGLSEAQKRAYLLADNRVSEDAKLDRKALADQLPELGLLFEEAGLELTNTGFEVAELDSLVFDFGDEPAEDEEADPADDEPVLLRSGDLFALSEHRLVIGDARDPAILDQLMAGEKAEAAFLDVPYNVRVRDIVGRGRVQHAEFAFASGEMTRPDFVAFLTAALGNAARVSSPGAVHFACIDWKHVRDLIEAGEAVYGAYLNLIAWTKTNAGQGGLYRNQHELIGVFRVGEAVHRDNVQQGRFGRNRSNVWSYAGANTFRAGRLQDLADHPTVKPTALVADALKDVSRRGALVLDTFVGSGTTILAAEQVGRRARAVEISPRYAQVALRRWEAMTGRGAVHLASGLSLDALISQRKADAVAGAVDAKPDAEMPAGTKALSSPQAMGEPVSLPRPRVRTRPAA